MRALHREPEDALAIEERRVRIAGGLGQLVLGHVAGRGIELADIALRIRGEPDVAVLSAVSPCGPDSGVAALFLDRAGLGIDAPSEIRELAGVPERAVGVASGSCGREPSVGTIHP